MRSFSTTAACAIFFLAFIGHTPLATLAATVDFKQPNAYAVVIGISQYREEVVPKIAYAAKDAEAMAQLLETQGGVPKTHIKVLTDSKATLADFRNHVGDWLKMRVKPDSTVYVYYAGHGTPNPKTGEAFLVPWEGHPDFPSGLYPLKELYDTLNKLPAKEIVVFLDSCFSGSPGRSLLAKGARPMVISVENSMLAGEKVIVLAAATEKQISSEYEKVEHGLFTYYLLAGLQGEADSDHDGIVTLGEIYPYVREQVSKTSAAELNREQTPVMLPMGGGITTKLALPLSHGGHFSASKSLEAMTEEEREWQKEFTAMTRANPAEYRMMVAFAQMILGRLGYGTGPFDGLLDEKTRKALREYQQYNGLSPTGEVDYATVKKLEVDEKIELKMPVSLPGKHIFFTFWDTYVSATGTWIMKEEKQADPLQTTEITCRRELGSCTEATAVVSSVDSGLGPVLSLVTSTYEIERWDDHEIVTKPKEFECVRYTLRFNRSLETVTAIRTIHNREDEMCRAFRNSPDYHLELEDGFKVWRELDKARGKAVRRSFRLGTLGLK